MSRAGKYTAEHERFCVELRKMGKKQHEIEELFQDYFKIYIPRCSLVKILEKHNLTGNPKRTFTPSMIDYLKKEFKEMKDIPRIAVKLGLNNSQVSNKVMYLGLAIPVEKEFDNNELDATKQIRRINSLKANVTLESNVKVKHKSYNKDADMVESVQIVPVVGIYPYHISVIVSGHRVSYYWDEIIGVVN